MQEMDLLESQILHNEFPAHRAAAAQTLMHAVRGLAQLTSHRYRPDSEIGGPGDLPVNRRLAEGVTRAWHRIGFVEALSAVQRGLLMELLMQHGAILEKGWLQTPKGKLRIDFDPSCIKKPTEA